MMQSEKKNASITPAQKSKQCMQKLFALLFLLPENEISVLHSGSTGGLTISSVVSSRPRISSPIRNVTVNVGREAVLECHVDHLGKYRVGWLKAKDQVSHSIECPKGTFYEMPNFPSTHKTILALHKKVITHNKRVFVDHEENRVWKLKIRHVQWGDRGCYMCQINTESMMKEIGCIDVRCKARCTLLAFGL